MSSKISMKNNLGNTLTISHSDDVENISVDSVDLSKVITINSLSELKDKVGGFKHKPPTIWISGYHTKGDNAFGSHIFEWDENCTENHNGGTIIDPNADFPTDWTDETQLENWFNYASITNGRYKLRYNDAVNVKWFGAKGDGITDDTISIQKAVDNFSKLYFPNGNYLLTSQIVYNVNIEIEIHTDINTIFINNQYMPTLKTNILHNITGNNSRKETKTDINEINESIEFLVTPNTTDGNKVALYTGIDYTNVTDNNRKMWAFNPNVNVHEGFKGEAYAIEADVNVDNDATNLTGYSSGLFLAGKGDFSNMYNNAAIWMRRGDGGSYWQNGIKIEDCITGIMVESNVRDYAILIKGDSRIQYIPTKSDGSMLISGANTTNTETLWKITNLGDATFNIGYLNELKIGYGNYNLKKYDRYFISSYSFPAVSANSSVDVALTDIFNEFTDETIKKSIIITIDANIPSGLVWNVYYNSGYKLRLTNVTSTDIVSFVGNILASVFNVN